MLKLTPKRHIFKSFIIIIIIIIIIINIIIIKNKSFPYSGEMEV
jgi:hypothetical protein